MFRSFKSHGAFANFKMPVPYNCVSPLRVRRSETFNGVIVALKHFQHASSTAKLFITCELIQHVTLLTKLGCVHFA